MIQAFEPQRRDADADPQDAGAEIRAILSESRSLNQGEAHLRAREQFLSFFESHWTPGQARNAWTGRSHVLFALIKNGEPALAAAAFEVLTCCQISALLIEEVACQLLGEGGPASWLAFHWLSDRPLWRPAVSDSIGRFLAQARHRALYNILHTLPSRKDEIGPLLPWLVKILRHSDSGMLRRRIIQVIGKLGEQAAPVVDVLVEAFECGPTRQKMSLVRSFGGIGPKIAGLVVPKLRASWRRPWERWLRGAIIEALVKLGDPELESLIRGDWNELSEAQKLSAILGLSEIGARGRLPLIVEATTSVSWRLRRSCAQALRRACGDPAQERELLGALLLDQHWRVRLAALEALKFRGQRADYEWIKGCYEGLAPSTRRRAEAILQGADQESWPSLSTESPASSP